MQRERHLVGDRHAAAWQADYHRPLVSEALERGSQPAPCVTPVAEERLWHLRHDASHQA